MPNSNELADKVFSQEVINEVIKLKTREVEENAIKEVADKLQGMGYACVNLGGSNGTIILHFLHKETLDYLSISTEESLDDEILCNILGVDIEEYSDGDNLNEEKLKEVVAKEQIKLGYNEYGNPYCISEQNAKAN